MFRPQKLWQASGLPNGAQDVQTKVDVLFLRQTFKALGAPWALQVCYITNVTSLDYLFYFEIYAVSATRGNESLVDHSCGNTVQWRTVA